MMSVPAAPVRTVVVRVCNVVVDRVEVRAAVTAAVTAEVTGGVSGARRAATIAVPEAGQIGSASGVARC
jgi:hypothetical protein